MDRDEKIRGIKSKLKMLGINVTGNSNSWALEIEENSLFGYVDISGNPQIVFPKYLRIYVLKHFVICRNPEDQTHVMIKGNTDNVISGVEHIKWRGSNIYGAMDSRCDTAYSKLQIFEHATYSGIAHVLIVSCNGKTFEIKHREHLITIKKLYLDTEEKEICILILKEYINKTAYTRVIRTITIDEDLNIEDKEE